MTRATVIPFPNANAASVDYPALRRDLDRAVRRVCPRWLGEHVDDIVQIAMLQVLRVLSRRDGEPLSKTYLKRVAYTATVDEIRRVRAKREVALVDEGELPRSSRDPEAALSARELGQSISEALDKLPEARRRAVTLYLQGEGVSEAARRLGWNAKRTENLVYRGMADLRRHLAPLRAA